MSTNPTPSMRNNNIVDWTQMLTWANQKWF
jgi:hypothetical protein